MKHWSILTGAEVVAEALKYDCPFCGHGKKGEHCVKADGTRTTWPHQGRRDVARRFYDTLPLRMAH